MTAINITIPIPDPSINFPTFQKPKILGTFGQDANRKWIDDSSSYLKAFDHRYWKSRPIKDEPLNLNRGRVILKDPNFCSSEGIASMLEWLRRYPQDKPPDFVLFRGALTMIMKTPYERREPWSFSVVKYQDTIYLKAEETEYAKRQKFMMPPFVEKTMRWGFKFEHYLTSTSDSNLDEVVNTHEECDVIYRTLLEGMSIIYAAEIDAVFDGSKKPYNPEDFVEFKTSKEIIDKRQYSNFVRFKLLKWWCQSFLVGIPTIVCGFRDDNGFVQSIKDFELKSIPKMSGVPWKPNVCMGFLKNFLCALKDGLIDTPNVVYNVSCSAPGSVVSVYPTDLDISHVLPSWYTV